MPSALPRVRSLAPYGTAVVAVASALALKFELARFLTAESPFLLFHAAVLFAAWRGGIGPGLLATGLAALAADFYFIHPIHFLNILDDPSRTIPLATFVAEGTFISLLSDLRLRSSRDADRRAEELRVAVTKKESQLTRTTVSLEAEAARRLEVERERQQLVTRLTTISEDERRRLSRELHDQTSQLLAALIAGLKTIRGQSGVGTAAGLEGLQRQAEQISRSVHRIAWELRPAALDAMGLEAATASWVERWSEWVGVPVEFHSTLGPIRLQPEVETQIYRIVTEALSNVLKHARASRTGVSLEHHRGMIVACVEDDGQGFDPESAADRGGLGLLGMRERATLLGGTLHVESAPGRGTTVLIRVPCPTFSGGNS